MAVEFPERREEIVFFTCDFLVLIICNLSCVGSIGLQRAGAPLHADFYFRLTAVFPALPITSLASQAAFPLDYDEAP